MPEVQLDVLLSALGDDAPCGANLEYEPAFLEMERAAGAKREQEYGAMLQPAEEPKWAVVQEHSAELALRTRDLRVAVLLTRSAARVRDLPEAIRGLQLIHGLLERHWEHVHPQLDASEGNDSTARVNALLPLLHSDAGLRDLRSASLTGQRGTVTLRDIELALGHVDPLAGESVPTEAGVLEAVAAALQQSPGLGEQLRLGYEAVQGLARCLEERLAISDTPDFTPLKKLMQLAAEAGRRAAASGNTSSGLAAGIAAIGASGHQGAIGSRADALRALDRVCEWIERNEPTNPAPLLIRRSQRLMTKTFLEIIRDLAPQGVTDIEKLAGTST